MTGRAGLLEPQQGRELGQFSQRQQAVRERTEALKNRLDQLSPVHALSEPRNYGSNIGGAGGRIYGRSPGRAERASGSAGYTLLRKRLYGVYPRVRQEAMQRAMQQMAQRGQMGQIQCQWCCVDRKSVCLESATVPRPLAQDQGRMGTNTRDFKIPGKEEYKVPKQFREEIMEALKRGGPSQFKGQIGNILRF